MLEDIVPRSERLNQIGIDTEAFDVGARTEKEGLLFVGRRPTPQEWDAMLPGLRVCIMNYEDAFPQSFLEFLQDPAPPTAAAWPSTWERLGVWVHSAALIHHTRRLNSVLYTREIARESVYMKARFTLGDGPRAHDVTYIGHALMFLRICPPGEVSYRNRGSAFPAASWRGSGRSCMSPYARAVLCRNAYALRYVISFTVAKRCETGIPGQYMKCGISGGEPLTPGVALI
jgi:hypothetical protein